MKPLYGQRLSSSPVRDLSLVEIAQVYAFLVSVYGEDNTLCYEALEELKTRNEKYQESIKERDRLCKEYDKLIQEKIEID